MNDPHTYPTEIILKDALGESYAAYESLVEAISGPEYRLTMNWHYYKDGKAWLCKVSHKKKTVFWLSVWNKYFKTGFYFTEKTGAGLAGLDIPERLKEAYRDHKPVGKLRPLTIDIHEETIIPEVLKVIGYKINV